MTAFSTKVRNAQANSTIIELKSGKVYHIKGLGTTKAKLIDGTEAEYVQITHGDEVRDIHPKTISRLLDEGKTAQFRTGDYVSPRSQSKKAKAVTIFHEMSRNGSTRQDIMGRMQSELSLTPVACATYYQNCRTGAWK